MTVMLATVKVTWPSLTMLPLAAVTLAARVTVWGAELLNVGLLVKATMLVVVAVVPTVRAPVPVLAAKLLTPLALVLPAKLAVIVYGPAIRPAGRLYETVATPEALTAAITGARLPTAKLTVPPLTVPPVGLVTVAVSVTDWAVGLLNGAETLPTATVVAAAPTVSVP